MTELTLDIIQTARVMSLWEALAVVLAIVYLVLAIRENIACWIAAIFSTSIYIVLMYQAGLYMESALQFFYIGMAVYGWISWQKREVTNHELRVTSWPVKRHGVPLLLILAATLISGFVLNRYTMAAMPYLDSFTTWGAIVTTWMVARKILQNWHYWFIIDSLSIYLYVSRGLYLTAMLFALYLVLIVVGYREWSRSIKLSRA